jgi:hypothetical protein
LDAESLIHFWLSTSDTHRNKNSWLLTPIAGILLFIVLYVTATFYYPGGTNEDTASVGFNWLHNYWCDLTGELAKNGSINPARPLALAAMMIICFSLGVFWYHLPLQFKIKVYPQAIRYAGMSSMMVTVFLFTGYHDTVIYFGGALCAIALTGTFIALYRNKYFTLLTFGLICLTFMTVNYFIYITGLFLVFLPLLQKATFLLFMTWNTWMAIFFFKKSGLTISDK